jgi:hypothetical protein
MRSVEGFITGPALSARLESLSRTANEHHREACKAWRGALEHACNAGAALQEAYERLGRRGKWGRWLRTNFEGSPRLARDYRRIHREWNDPRLIAARVGGFERASIQAVLNILRGKQPPMPDTATADEQAAAWNRNNIRTTIAAKLLSLDTVEVELLASNLDRLWTKLYDDLRRTVNGALEHDHYGDNVSPQHDSWARTLCASNRGASSPWPRSGIVIGSASSDCHRGAKIG